VDRCEKIVEIEMRDPDGILLFTDKQPCAFYKDHSGNCEYPLHGLVVLRDGEDLTIKNEITVWMNE
jgi:hypothetical protein